MLAKSIGISVICASMLLLAGCYRNVNITLHEPGKYKGPQDPLLAKLKTPDWQGKLQQRFKLSQTDR